jgi:ABC-type antimicrobial peptide transport system permease subunit
VGASRKTLIFQYLGESLSLTGVSLLLAIMLVELFLPQFNEITGKNLTLQFSLQLILILSAITLLTGLLAGSYPAIYLSGFNPVDVLKGRLLASAGEVWVRKGLVTFQFFLSVVLMVAVVVVYKQIEYVQTKNLGYEKDQILTFPKEGKVAENLEAFLAEVKNIPGVVNASSLEHSMVKGENATYDLQWEGKNPEEMIRFEKVSASYDIIETLGIEMAAGRAFSRNFGSDQSRIILNESAIKAMGLKDPVGKVIGFEGKEMQVVGVTKDFHFESLHEPVKPLLFALAPDFTHTIVVKIEAGKEGEATRQLQERYARFNPGFVLDFKFLDAAYQNLYTAEKQVSLLSRYFAGLAILISCLGLFGLAAFTAERRVKEIGIRKVLGASALNIIYLLSGDFTKWVLLAICVALPVSFFLVQRWLSNFAYSIDLEWWVLPAAGALTLLIALLTVSFQAVKAALMNPVKSLRSE